MDRRELFRSTTPFFDAVAHTAQACWGYGRALKQAVADELLAADYDSDDALRERLQRADAFLEPFKPHCIAEGEVVDLLLGPLWTNHHLAFERPRQSPAMHKLYPSTRITGDYFEAQPPFRHWEHLVTQKSATRTQCNQTLVGHENCKADTLVTVRLLISERDHRNHFRFICTGCGVWMGMIARTNVIAPVEKHTASFEQAQRDQQKLRETRQRAWMENWEKQRNLEREQRRAEYRKYLQSDQWRKKRAAVMQRANGICEGCQRARAVEVHHLHYKNVFNEPLWDLVASCEACHRSVHGHAAH